MNTRFQKIAITTAVTAALAGVSLPSQAIVVGSAGEALLVPLVVWSENQNTIIEVETPASVGWEDVANLYTAPWTTPTNAALTLTPADPDLTKTPDKTPRASIHWFWFDQYSDHKADDALPVTPDDIVQLNWKDLAGNNFRDKLGYMVIVDDKAYSTGAPATFSMFGDAWLVGNIETPIPVLPLNDGQDVAGVGPTNLNNVVYGKSATGNTPPTVSPMISGMRTSLSDGNMTDKTVFDMKLSPRTAWSLHVIWLDQNRWEVDPNWEFEDVYVNVYDTDENACSVNVDVPDELNVIKWHPVCAGKGDANDMSCISEAALAGGGWGWTGNNYATWCEPVSGKTGYQGAGMARYQLPEYVDNNSGTVDSAGVAFALVSDAVGLKKPNDFDFETALAHDRGVMR
jgi:hypothetical protein